VALAANDRSSRSCAARSTLALFLEFDLARVADADALPGRDHAAAVAAACAASGLCSAAAVAVASSTTDGAADVAAARALPLSAWRAAPPSARAVRLDFLYSAAPAPARQLCVRVLTELSRCDGVTATRLALHVLESLERTPLCGAASDASAFKPHPPFTFTPAHALRALPLSLAALAGASWAHVVATLAPLAPPPDDVAVPHSPAGMAAYYRTAHPPPAALRCFAPGRLAYADLLSACDAWRVQSRRDGFFVLLNFSPHVVPAVLRRVEELTAPIETRLRGAFAPPGHPPAGGAWFLMNAVHVGLIFINNYGRHTHTFKARPTAFLWDWLGLAAPVPGAGCITVNGVTMAWQRSTPADVGASADIFEGALGKPTAEFEQLPWPPAAAEK
jgi:hypothetical protein